MIENPNEETIFPYKQDVKKIALIKGKFPCCSRSCSSKLYGNNQYGKPTQ